MSRNPTLKDKSDEIKIAENAKSNIHKTNMTKMVISNKNLKKKVIPIKPMYQ